MCRSCVILAGGEIDIKTVSIPEKAAVICADRGYLAAKALGAEPVLVIGDFDSLGFVPCTDNVKIYPSEKDDTDTFLAVKEALKMGASEIAVYGALGGRLDHTLANIQLLKYILENQAEGVLIGTDNRITMQKGGSVRRYKRREDWYFSVLSYSEKCTGVCINGTEYTLSEGVLENDYPLGVSNHITEEYAEISLEEGCILVIESKES